MAGADSRTAPRRRGAGDAIVVTGIGALTPLGSDVAAHLAGPAGRPPTATRSSTDVGRRPARPHRGAAGATRPRPARRDPARTSAAGSTGCSSSRCVAAREAWADAGSPEVDPERLGVVRRVRHRRHQTLLAQYDVLKERGAGRVSPHPVPMLMPNGPAATVGLEFGGPGRRPRPGLGLRLGCRGHRATALDMIRAGRADVVVAGGSEAAIHPLPIAGFAAMRALSHAQRRARAPPRVRTTRRRDGFVHRRGRRHRRARARVVRPGPRRRRSTASSPAPA